MLRDSREPTLERVWRRRLGERPFGFRVLQRFVTTSASAPQLRYAILSDFPPVAGREEYSRALSDCLAEFSSFSEQELVLATPPASPCICRHHSTRQCWSHRLQLVRGAARLRFAISRNSCYALSAFPYIDTFERAGHHVPNEVGRSLQAGLELRRGIAYARSNPAFSVSFSGGSVAPPGQCLSANRAEHSWLRSTDATGACHDQGGR
jgi:hypothetical protein